MIHIRLHPGDYWSKIRTGDEMVVPSKLTGVVCPSICKSSSEFIFGVFVHLRRNLGLNQICAQACRV
jgi:hypothetical protein